MNPILSENTTNRLKEKTVNDVSFEIIPKLVFGGEEIKIPPGLKELLKKSWSHSDSVQINPVVEKYERRTEKANGHWRTIYSLKKAK